MPRRQIRKVLYRLFPQGMAKYYAFLQVDYNSDLISLPQAKAVKS
jgi:hypothetical protein